MKRKEKNFVGIEIFLVKEWMKLLIKQGNWWNGYCKVLVQRIIISVISIYTLQYVLDYCQKDNSSTSFI